MSEGAYDTYKNFISENPKMNRDSILRYIGKNSDANAIILPNRYFEDFFGVVLNGQFTTESKVKEQKINCRQ